MKKFMIIALGCAVATGVLAESKGFQASLTPDIAVHDRDTEINGVSIGVWNENPSPKFNWQLGFVNGATGDSVGVQWFIFLPTIYNYAENYTGAQLGFVNYTSDTFVGAQLGAVNIAGTMTGFQWGVVNYAGTANNLFQLGLVNIIADNEWFSDFPSDFAKGMVLVNWSFGGSD
ncbi:MAG: hypothetical protein KAU94_12400 [Verrucomicrobia bacterium]|nr:hypothetical protein [Verrucomicrobiota bacterium]